MAGWYQSSETGKLLLGEIGLYLPPFVTLSNQGQDKRSFEFQARCRTRNLKLPELLSVSRKTLSSSFEYGKGLILDVGSFCLPSILCPLIDGFCKCCSGRMISSVSFLKATSGLTWWKPDQTELLEALCSWTFQAWSGPLQTDSFEYWDCLKWLTNLCLYQPRPRSCSPPPKISWIYPLWCQPVYCLSDSELNCVLIIQFSLARLFIVARSVQVIGKGQNQHSSWKVFSDRRLWSRDFRSQAGLSNFHLGSMA